MASVENRMNTKLVHFDAPFWVGLLATAILLGCVGCLGVAAAAQNASKGEAGIVSMDDS